MNFSVEPEYVRMKRGIAITNGGTIAGTGSAEPADMYHTLGCSYPKFFKMDSLCKWAWLGAEILLRKSAGWRYDGLDKSSIAIVIATANGCLDVDKRYAETLSTIPSPALFVYTLPNIMLGEICIRHGFTGEQLCRVQEDFDADELHFWVEDLLMNRDAAHCLFGWVDAADEQHDVCLFWADAQNIRAITPASLKFVYDM